MVRHVKEGIIGREVIESEKSAESGLFAIRDGTGLVVNKPGLDLAVDGAKETGTPDKDTGEVELVILGGAVTVRFDVGVFGRIAKGNVRRTVFR